MQLIRWRLRTGILRGAGVVGRLVFKIFDVSKNDLDGRAADPRIRNRKEVDSSPIHVGVACCHWTTLGFVSVSDYTINPRPV
jgi:hypothetical protein